MVNRKVLQQMIMHKTIAKLQTPLKNNKPGKYGLFLTQISLMVTLYIIEIYMHQCEFFRYSNQFSKAHVRALLKPMGNCYLRTLHCGLSIGRGKRCLSLT